MTGWCRNGVPSPTRSHESCSVFGYVRPSAARLTEEDTRRFGAAYCGLCRAMGMRHGQAARFILNYDFAFLSILLWPEGDAAPPLHRGCMAHPLAGRDYFPVNSALELAADEGVILAWWQIQDALTDPGGGKSKYRAAAAALLGAYRRARTYRPDFDRITQAHLRRLREMEEAGNALLDEPADAFAQLLAGAAEAVEEPVIWWTRRTIWAGTLTPAAITPLSAALA